MFFQSAPYFAVPISIVGSTIVGLGYVLEKKAADELDKIEETSFIQNVKNFITNKTWLMGWLLTMIGLPIASIAFSLGSILLINSLSGFTIISITFFSIVILKESISKKEFIAIGIIVVGMTMVSIPASLIETQKQFEDFWELMIKKNSVFVMGGFFSVSVLFLLYSILSSLKLAGTAFSLFAGIAMGLATILLKAFSTNLPAFSRFSKIEILTDWRIVLIITLWSLLSILATFTLNFSFQKGKAIHIIPLYNNFIFLVPITYAIISLNEWIIFSHIQRILIAVGLLVILVGLTYLSFLQEQKKMRKEEKHRQAD